MQELKKFSRDETEFVARILKLNTGFVPLSLTASRAQIVLVSRVVNSFTNICDAIQDQVSIGGPLERLWIFIVLIKVRLNCFLE